MMDESMKPFKLSFVLRSAFRAQHSASRAHRSSLIAYRFLVLSLIALLSFCAINADAQGSWRRQPAGTLAWLHAVYFLDAQQGWAVGGNGALLTTTDGGATWRVQPRPTEDSLTDVYFADARRGWLVCERAVYQLAAKDEQRSYLMSTMDGGQNWRRVDVIGKDVDARLVRALFGRDGSGWAFGEGGLLYTTRDDGRTWLLQRVPTRRLLLGGTFLDSAHGWLVGAGATILQTDDGGATWRAGAVPDDSGARARFTAINFVNAQRGWAVGAKGAIFSTRDGGRTWRAQISNVESDLLDVKFVNPTEGWICGADGVLLHTWDGGRRWTIEPSGTTHTLERLHFDTFARGWAVGFGGTIIAYDAGIAPRAPQLKNQNNPATTQTRPRMVRP